MGITEIDTTSVSAILMALEHHIKSILCRGGPSRRHKRKFAIPSIAQYLAMEDNKEILDHYRPGVIDSSDLRVAMPLNTNLRRGRYYLYFEDTSIQPVTFSCDPHLPISSMLPEDQQATNENDPDK
eukprot:TRINITY_DN1162_c0_g1_i10.p2 TRINITY_DN1162_c0_g1~~TRINITY_DN1162_c0_g1_i10.p2  ORF type:complete len:126 (+),score=17.97 TRINITY_DN1162_c0_g1_i10:262-639(+)